MDNLRDERPNMTDRPSNPYGANKSDTSLMSTIADLNNLVAEIKCHVIEPMPKNEVESSVPCSEHKLDNVNEELRRIKRHLQEILQAVDNL